MDTARRVFRSYGFSPIDTPALEYLEILLGKGSDETDKQLYRFQDHGGRDVGLRFDLTVPLARFAAQHIGAARHALQALPHRHRVARREHAARPLPRVHAVRLRHDRHDRPSPPTSKRCSSSTICSRRSASSGFTIRVNHRGVLNGLLQKLGLADRSAAVLRALDKLARSAAKRVAEEMTQRPVRRSDKPSSCSRSSSLARQQRRNAHRTRARWSPATSVGERASSRLARSCGRRAALPAFERAIACSSTLDRPRPRLLHRSRARNDRSTTCPSIGSVCSGGRYDNLAELYTKQQLPGIGASLGLDRLLAAMEELEHDRAGPHAGRGVRALLRCRRTSAIISGWPPNCVPPASASRCIPSPRSSASSCSTPTAQASGSRWWPASESSPPASARSKTSPAARARPCSLADDAAALIARNSAHLGE